MTVYSKLFCLAFLAPALTNCKIQSQSPKDSETLAAQGAVSNTGSVLTTLVDDATQSNGNGTYKMGVRNPGINGIVCRKFAGKAGVNFDSGKALVFYTAPSDSFFGKVCGKNPYGGEPSCAEISDECGKRIEITCNDPERCTKPGELSMFSQMVKGFRDTKGQNSMDSFNDLKNILKTHYNYTDATLANVVTPKSIVLVINDFCPLLHSQNSGHCKGAHLDVSNAAYLLYGKANAQGYISPNVTVNYIYHENNTAELGPKW